MPPKILRRCDICGKYHVAYVVEDTSLGKLYLCHSCWKARITRQTGDTPANPTSDGETKKVN